MYTKNKTFESSNNKDTLKLWIAELTDLTPQQIEAVVERSVNERSATAV